LRCAEHRASQRAGRAYRVILYFDQLAALLPCQLASSPESDPGLAGVGIGPGVPQFEAVDDAVAGQRDGAAASAGADYVANLQGLGFAVAVMDYNVVELDGSVADAKLQGAKAPGTSSRFNIVMIMLTVDVGFSQKNPVGSMGQACGRPEQRQGTKRDKKLSHARYLPSSSWKHFRFPELLSR